MSLTRMPVANRASIVGRAHHSGDKASVCTSNPHATVPAKAVFNKARWNNTCVSPLEAMRAVALMISPAIIKRRVNRTVVANALHGETDTVGAAGGAVRVRMRLAQRAS